MVDTRVGLRPGESVRAGIRPGLLSMLLVGLLAGCGGGNAPDGVADTSADARPTEAGVSTAGEVSPSDDTSEQAETPDGAVGVVTVDGTATDFTGSCQDLRDLSGRLIWFGTGTGPDGDAAELTVTYTLEPPSGAFAVVTDDPSADEGRALNVRGPAESATFDDTTITVAGQVDGSWTGGDLTSGEATVPCPVE